MATHTIYILATTAVTPNFWGNTQLDGAAPTVANTAYGWTPSATNTVVPYYRGRHGAISPMTSATGSSYNAGTSGPAKGTGTANTTAGDSFIAGPFTGTFAAAAWDFNWNLRASVVGAVGHVNMRIWKSANADGTSATQLLANTAGATVTLSTSADVNSSISWSPGALTLTNEYLFFQLEWQETVTGVTNCNVLFSAGAAAITTPDLPIAGGTAVVLLCHFDGTNGSTTFTDVSPSAHALTPAVLTVSTANPKFGSGAGSYTTGASLLAALAGLTDFNFGAGQFTIEAWVRFASAPSGIQIVMAQWPSSASNLGWTFRMTSGSLAFFYSTTGTDFPGPSAAFSPTLNTYYHLAVDRDAANMLRIYVNGAVLTSATASATLFASTATMYIGNDGAGTRGFPGLIDEVRITKGTAQYGGAFTPPTAPFNGVAASQAQAVILA